MEVLKMKLALGLRWSFLQCRRAAFTPQAMRQHSFPQENPSPQEVPSPSLQQGSSTSDVETTADPTSNEPSTLHREAPRQFLTTDRETIVCIHPTSPVDISNTKPLHPYKPQMDVLRARLDPHEAKYVKKLRSEDSDLWSVATLARLFNVKRIAISKVSPADESRQEVLENERQLTSRMRPYRRKLYLLEREAKRQKRLQQALAQSNYKFPNGKV